MLLLLLLLLYQFYTVPSDSHHQHGQSPQSLFLQYISTPLHDLSEILEQPTSNSEDQLFFLLVSYARCELIENKNK